MSTAHAIALALACTLALTGFTNDSHAQSAPTARQLLAGKPGKFTKELASLVDEPQRAFADVPNSWDFFIEVGERSRETYDAFYAPRKGEKPTPDAEGNVSQYRDPPGGWPEGFAWPLDGSELWQRDVPPIVFETFRELTASLDEAKILESLDELATRRRFSRPIPEGKLIELLLPELGRSRHVARQCAGRLALAAHDGDQAGMLRAFEHALAMAKPMGRQATLIDHLVAIAIHAMMFDRAQRLALDGRLDPDTIRALLVLFDRDAEILDPRLPIRGERLMFKDTVEWTHTDDGNGDGVVIVNELRSVVSQNQPEPGLFERFAESMALGLLPTKRQTLAEGDRFYSRVEDLASMGYRRRLSEETIEQWVNQIPEKHAILKMLLPAFDRVLASYDQIESERVATKLILSLELHRQTLDEFPATLDDLAPITLGELDIDPEWLAEFRYVRGNRGAQTLLRNANDTQPDGNPRAPITLAAAGYTLYALGADGLDDGGARSPDDGHRAVALRRSSASAPRRDVVYVPRGSDD